ncbi:MAG: site-2 protease family protein [Epsilonproteobacteria bacterium]|jgi:Zn-dependent protease|nr:site-2 protease family protein [Campylobacterota bacterium]
MDIINIIAMVLALLIAIIGHEIMHGAVAKIFGDYTALYAGRLSINPIKHVDVVGTIIFPVFLFLSQKMAGVSHPVLFGWAKPVPVDMNIVIRNGGYLAGVAVSLAGVFYNIIVAVIASLFIHFEPSGMVSVLWFYLLYHLIFINVILFVFNLIPIPPLDGANAVRYLADFIGMKQIGVFFDKIENYGMIIIIVLLFTPLGHTIFAPAQLIINHLIGG